MAENEKNGRGSGLATIGAIVGLIGGGFGIYKSLTSERAQEKVAAAYLQVVGASAHAGYLPIAGENLTHIEIKVRNIGKRDAVDITTEMIATEGSRAVFRDRNSNIIGQDLPPVIEPGATHEITFTSMGLPEDVANARYKLDSNPKISALQRMIGPEYQYRGITYWRDRGSEETGSSEWCFEGGVESFRNKVTQKMIKERHKNDKTDFTEFPYALEPCRLKKDSDNTTK